MLQDNQETFDTVVRHLATMKSRSMDTGPLAQCRYRNKDGSKCAAGCLIPDEDYVRNMEGFPIRFNDDTAVSNYFRERGYDLSLLRALQKVHDRQPNWDEDGLNRDGISALRVVADVSCLCSSVVDVEFNHEW